MDIDGNRIQQLTGKWQYKGYRLISMNINETGYELIAVRKDLKGVKVTAESLDNAIQHLKNEIDIITESDFTNFGKNVREKLLTRVA